MTDLSGFRALHGRPRGFVSWTPRARTAQIIADVLEVLEEYSEFLPLTLRQIFYRLVATCGFPKTETAARELRRRECAAGLVARREAESVPPQS